MLNDRITELITRKLSGEISPAESEELETFFQQHPDEQYFAELISEYWQSSNPLGQAEDLQPDKHFHHILELAENNNTNNKEIILKSSAHFNLYIKRFSIAASVIVAIACILYLSKKENIPKATENEITEVVAKPGARTRILLPDGTTVWLNSGSRLSYKRNFNDTIREVELEGEAFFDVVKNVQRAFIVHTSGINIRVLGTEFNVKSYPGEATIETILLRGVIEVENKSEPKAPKIILHPHEKLTFNKKEIEAPKFDKKVSNVQSTALKKSDEISISAIPKNIADTAIKETSWIYNKLIFDGDTFSELAGKMERWFNVTINFQDKIVANYRFRGVFENETIEQALKALQLTASFDYKINNNEVDIYKK